jgi:hypothetical protein
MKKLILLLALQSIAASATDMDEIQQCLRSWGTHPFAKENPEYRTISSKVKVMGIGNEMTDTKNTTKPELVLLKPSVNVMSKSVVSLLNPNGWYCVKGKVDVLGKTEINLHCKAHMTSSNDGATVLGSNEAETGVTVLGKSIVNRVGCSNTKEL